MRAAGLTRLDLAHPQALYAIEPVTRSEVQENFDAIVHTDLPPEVLDDVYVGRTSGSTGQPLRYLADGYSYLWYWAFVDFVLASRSIPIKWRRGRVDAVLLCALGHSPEYGDFLPLFHGVRFQKVNVTAPGAREKLERLNPQLITGDPDSLEALLQFRVRPKVVLSSAFPMPEQTQRQLKAHLGAPVVQYYSSAEIGMMGVESEVGGTYEVLSPAVAVEVLPELGTSASTPRGEITVTNLRNPWFPLIRYRTGDRASIEAPAEGDPLRVSRLVELRGRTVERFEAVGGGVFDPNALAPILSRSDSPEVVIVETNTGRYRLQCLRVRPNEGVLTALRARLSELHRGAITLEVALHQEPWRLPGEKPRPFVSERRA